MHLLALIGCVVIFQYFGHVFLAINGDSSESEEFMLRKLAVLHRIIGFAFGPAIKEFVKFSVTLIVLLFHRLCYVIIMLSCVLKWSFT